jgi:hypothetical protein
VKLDTVPDDRGDLGLVGRVEDVLHRQSIVLDKPLNQKRSGSRMRHQLGRSCDSVRVVTIITRWPAS